MADLLILKGVDIVLGAIQTLSPEQTVIRSEKVISHSYYTVKQSFWIYIYLLEHYTSN